MSDRNGSFIRPKRKPPAPDAPVTPPVPKPAPTPEPQPVPAPAPLAIPTGTARSRRPIPSRAPFNVPWLNATRWTPQIDEALTRYPKVREWLGDLTYRFYWSLFLIESDGNQFYPEGDPRGAGRVVEGGDRYGGGTAKGVAQVKNELHQGLDPDADWRTAAGNIRLATALLNQLFAQHKGDWRKVIRSYHPGKSPGGVTPDTYVESMEELMAEAEADAGPKPPPPAVDPMLVITGGVPFDDSYGWLSRAGIDYSNYATGHGTTQWDEHPGIDLGVPAGTTLHTPAAGVAGCIGERGTPQPGRACGSYPDDLGGIGNITIKLDEVPGVPPTWLTIGHCRAATVKPGDRVKAGQAVGTVGTAGGGYHPHVETAILDPGTPRGYRIIEPRKALAPFLGAAGDVVDPRQGLVPHTILGSSRPIYLPKGIKFIIIETPVGPNRQNLPMEPRGTVYHETGNSRPGTGAEHHARWQRDGTEGHPDNRPGGPNIGVHFYNDAGTVVQTLPVNVQGIHSGDQLRNSTRIAVEQCVNIDGDLEGAEATAEALHATLLRDVIGTTVEKGLDRHSTGACPARLNRLGEWSQTKADVARLMGGGLPGPAPGPLYPGLTIPVAVFEALFVDEVRPDPNGAFTKWMAETGWYFPVHRLIPGAPSYLITAGGILKHEAGKVTVLK